MKNFAIWPTTMVIERISSPDGSTERVPLWQDAAQTRSRPRRSALRRVNGFLKNMIEAIANSKLRRMERELELRGIGLDRASNNWVTRDPGRDRVRND
jgi:hypothetical protein